MAVRAVGYGVFVASAVRRAPGRTDRSSDLTGSAVVGLLGMTLMAGSALVDVITVPGDVDRRNAAWLEQHASVGLRIAPDADSRAGVHGSILSGRTLRYNRWP